MSKARPQSSPAAPADWQASRAKRKQRDVPPPAPPPQSLKDKTDNLKATFLGAGFSAILPPVSRVRHGTDNSMALPNNLPAVGHRIVCAIAENLS